MTVTMSVRLSAGEFSQFMELCRKNNVSRQMMLRAIVTDALAEEADAIRCEQSEGHSGSAEAGEGSRSAA